jgi:hypothetical protein
VGPIGQTPSVKPTEPVRSDRTTHSPPRLSLSRDAHGDCVARDLAGVRWPFPATAGLAATAKVTASFCSTFSLEESSWGAWSCPHASPLDPLGFRSRCLSPPTSLGLSPLARPSLLALCCDLGPLAHAASRSSSWKRTGNFPSKTKINKGGDF